MYLLDEKGTIRFNGTALEGFTFGYDRDGSFRQDYRLEKAVKEVLWGSPEIPQVIRELQR
jgi:hypothetical protein